MKEIRIKKLDLQHFKGLRDYQVGFNGGATAVYGENGTGKTTLMDAFLWLLFGKDSSDRTQFEIKTLEANGKPIRKVDHSVEGLLLVEGQQVKLKRVFREKWQKKRGSAHTEFTGHETEYFWNDVPLNQKEYMDKVAEIVPEETFRLVTNPNYFPSLKWNLQREILFNLAGKVSFAELAAGNKDFEGLLKELQGKTFDEFRKQIGASKRRIKEQLDQIQPRIDEVKRSMPAQEDWKELEGELSRVGDAIQAIEAAIMDKSKAFEQAYEKRSKLQEQLQQARMKAQQIIFQQAEQKQKHLAEIKARYNQAMQDEKSLNSELERLQKDKKATEEIITMEETLVAQWRQKWEQEAAKELIFSENDFNCPTCHRPLDVTDIEARQQEMTEEFNKNKSGTLAEISKAGRGVKATIETWKQKVEQLQQQIQELTGKGASLQENITSLAQELEKEQQQPANQVPESQKQAQATIEALEKQLAEPILAPDIEDLKKQKAQLVGRRDDIIRTLALKDDIKKAEARIAELEGQEENMAQEMADLEKKEYVMGQFTRLYSDEVEKRVNDRFSLVKFRLFDTQVNGQEVPTCQATVDGVPYSDLNNASKINAGLDILNALSRHHGILAPVWIDNAESVLHPIHVDSQLIRLVVSEDHPELSIVTHN